MLKELSFRLQFSFLSKLLIHWYSATSMWLQFAPVMENKLLGWASDKVSMHLGQTIKASLSMTICESGPWHMCLHNGLQLGEGSSCYHNGQAPILRYLFLMELSPLILPCLWVQRSLDESMPLVCLWNISRARTGDTINIPQCCLSQRASGFPRWTLLDGNWF